MSKKVEYKVSVYSVDIAGEETLLYTLPESRFNSVQATAYMAAHAALLKKEHGCKTQGYVKETNLFKDLESWNSKTPTGKIRVHVVC